MTSSAIDIAQLVTKSALSREKKRIQPQSRPALTGLCLYGRLRQQPAALTRGQLEITDINRLYMEAGELFFEQVASGYAWFDTGTHNSLLEASEFVRFFESGQGI